MQAYQRIRVDLVLARVENAAARSGPAMTRLAMGSRFFLAATTQAAAKADPAAFIDTSFVDQLLKEGYFR
jgi:hypothetical protein